MLVRIELGKVRGERGGDLSWRDPVTEQDRRALPPGLVHCGTEPGNPSSSKTWCVMPAISILIISGSAPCTGPVRSPNTSRTHAAEPKDFPPKPAVPRASLRARWNAGGSRN